MLLKIQNEDGNWEFFDGIGEHVEVRKLTVETVEPKDEGPIGITLRTSIATERGAVLLKELDEVPTFMLIDPENPRSSDLILNGKATGTFIRSVRSDGTALTFAFLGAGYLLSNAGKTIERFNR